MLDVGPLDAFYGDSHIVQNVSLSIGDGEGVAILGRNGVGKTTLFKSIMNGGPRVVGPIRHRGEDITTLPSFARARRGLRLRARGPADLSAPDGCGEYRHGRARGPSGRRSLFARRRVGDFSHAAPICSQRLGFEFSGGQQQLLAIARAMLCAARLSAAGRAHGGPRAGHRRTAGPAIERHPARERNGTADRGTECALCADLAPSVSISSTAASSCSREHGQSFDARPDLQQRYLAV